MRYLIDLGLPLFLLGLAAAGKWFMAGGRWDPEFACLGPDLLLGAFGAELAFLTNLGRRIQAVPTTVVTAEVGRQLILCSTSLVLTVLLLILAWINHRRPVGRRRGVGRRWMPRTRFVLLIVWNAVGVGILFAFLALVQVDA